MLVVLSLANFYELTGNWDCQFFSKSRALASGKLEFLGMIIQKYELFQKGQMWIRTEKFPLLFGSYS
jgi:hypothetical protein